MFFPHAQILVETPTVVSAPLLIQPFVSAFHVKSSGDTSANGCFGDTLSVQFSVTYDTSTVAMGSLSTVVDYLSAPTACVYTQHTTQTSVGGYVKFRLNSTLAAYNVTNVSVGLSDPSWYRTFSASELSNCGGFVSLYGFPAVGLLTFTATLQRLDAMHPPDPTPGVVGLEIRWSVGAGSGTPPAPPSGVTSATMV